MTREGWYHGGLVYLGATEGAIERFSRIVAGTLQDYGHQVDRQTVLSAEEARVVTSQYIIKLSLETASYSGRIVAHEHMSKQPSRPMHRVEIALMPVAPGVEDRDITELMMVVMLYRMVDAYPVQQIEWMDPETILCVSQFLGAFASVTPRRVHSHAQIQGPKSNRFAPVEEMEADLSEQAEIIEADVVFEAEQELSLLSVEESLALAFRDDSEDMIDPATPEEQAENDIRRLTAWGMTGMLVFLSGPVALSMAAVNLVKGEDFRLNTHVLALTAFVASFSGSGLLSNALSYLPV
ncbi:hypothetical protein [Antarcticimicrobium luteum]|uniref:Uncharacterized protein n=1 Tax=Antarcticimicrobium luteum TaxID=2547397 RepID=A0A4V3ASN3_9RHOB|nr:hypothetical protein [Antarcticimicrobium luteum]TDK51284.1 hypothetical protein E1832_03920 [Antarcticimicrobium luteum]